MINLTQLIFVFSVLALSEAGADQAAPANFKNIQIAIPAKMKGWSNPRPTGTGPILTYQGEGISFMTTANGKISTTYTWSLAQPAPGETDYLSDPFKLVQRLTYLQKKGDHPQMMKLLDPATDAKILAVLNRPDVIKADRDLYADATEGGILLGIEDGSELLIYYYIQKPSGKVLQLEILKKSGSSYVLQGSDPNASDSMPINIFTALYDTIDGISTDIQVTP